MADPFGALDTFRAGARTLRFHSLPRLEKAGLGLISRLPVALRVVLESLLRNLDGHRVREEDVRALCAWTPDGARTDEVPFVVARVLLQDFTGVPLVVDLAALRAAAARLGADPLRVEPRVPVDLVVDHSVQVDAWGSPEALDRNMALEMERNRQRYLFLKWGAQAFRRFRIVPPGFGICHQVNLEFLSEVVREEEGAAFFDSLVGTDSHTTMVNGLGVLGWGVGGIEAEAAMLGHPSALLMPDVVGVHLHGALAPGVTATDLVLSVTELLRRTGVVGKLVEFHGAGAATLPVATRATLANMAPEYGATCGFFPVDEATLRYLAETGRPPEVVERVRAYWQAQGMLGMPAQGQCAYSKVVDLDLASVEPAVAGPSRPQDRIPLSGLGKKVAGLLPSGGGAAPRPPTHGSVVIAAITSCTNTSNPAVMLAAGLVARKAVARGLEPPPWVKTSLAPGSRVVSSYLASTGLQKDLDALGFRVVGFGCTTCIGNSGPLDPAIEERAAKEGLWLAAVLSGNRNFEARIHPSVKANFLMSPPLVVAFALAGRMDLDLTREPLGRGADGRPVTLADLWPSPAEVEALLAQAAAPARYRENYADVAAANPAWQALPAPSGALYAFEADSSYVREPPFLEGVAAGAVAAPPGSRSTRGARALAILGDSVTTDHISPAGSIRPASPAGQYLTSLGVAPADFNSYGARRGNHEVMMRGTFANVRLKNLMVPGVEGGVTVHQPSGERLSIFDAARRYQAEGVPLLVVAGLEYGTGSSRDWAAKGTRLLGVRAVVARSFERIHRSNLVGMGVLPLELPTGISAATLGLDGSERFDLELPPGPPAPRQTAVLRISRAGGGQEQVPLAVRIDTAQEARTFAEGGILPRVLREVLAPAGR